MILKFRPMRVAHTAFGSPLYRRSPVYTATIVYGTPRDVALIVGMVLLVGT